MISPSALRSAIGRLGTMKFFPSSNQEFLKDLAKMLHANFGSDEDLERGVTWVLLESEVSEWPGSYDFNQLLARSIPRPRQYSSEGRDPNVFWVKPAGPEPAPWPEDEIAEVDRLFGKPEKAAL